MSLCSWQRRRRPAGGAGAVAAGGGGTAGAFVLRASYQDSGANGVDPILAGDIVLLGPQQLRPETAEIRGPGITYTPSRDPGFFIARSGAYIGFRSLDLTGIGRIEIAAVTQFYQWPTMQGATVEVRQDAPTGQLLGSVGIYPAAGGGAAVVGPAVRPLLRRQWRCHPGLRAPTISISCSSTRRRSRTTNCCW